MLAAHTYVGIQYTYTNSYTTLNQFCLHIICKSGMIVKTLFHNTIKFICMYMHVVQLMICTAPVPGTVDDFWQMIWDNRIDIVVMLTKTMEGRKVQAHSPTPQCTHDFCI